MAHRLTDTLVVNVRQTPETPIGMPATPDVDAAAASTQPLRLLLAVASLGALAVGFAGIALQWDWLRVSGLLTFCFVGVGSAPWQRHVRLRTYERLTVSFITAMAVLTLVPLLMTTVHLWYPGIAFILVSAVCLPMHAQTLQKARAAAGASRSRRWPFPYLSIASTRAQAFAILSDGLPATAPALMGTILCVVSACLHRHLEPGYYGFLPTIGVAWYLGLALVLVGVVLRRRPEHSGALPVVLLVLVLTLTPALTYDGPRSQSAAKHLAFIMQVQSVNTLDTSVPLYDAYAGFFIAMAWLCEVLGLADPLGLSVMWPVLLGLIRVIVLRYLAGQLLDSPGQCWVAVALAVLADSLGADYFSPQSVAFVLGLAAVGVALSRTLTRHRGLIVLAASVTLAVTHQLSPFIVGGVLVVLVLFGQCRPGWYPLLILGPAILWASLHYQAVLGSLSLETFGRAENFKPPTTTSAPDLERLPVVQNTVLALVAGIVIVGILAAIALARHVRERRYWALACCPAVGLVAVALTPYGQEGIFRAALFGLPWLAIMASDVLSHQFLGSRLMTRVTLAAMTGHLVIAHLVSSFGLDATDVVRQSDLAAVRHFETRGGASPPNLYYLLILNEGDHPTTPELAGTRHFTWSRDFLDEPVTEKRNFNGRREVQKLTDALLNYTQETDREARLFALWSPVGAVYSEAYGIQSMRQSLALRDAFGRSSFWTSQRFGDGTYLFRFVRGKYFGVDR